MADTVATLRPVDLWNAYESWYGPPGAVFPDDWADNDDATWWSTNIVGGRIEVTLTDASIPALAQIRWARVRLRADKGSAADPNTKFRAWLISGTTVADSASPVGSTAALDGTTRTYTLDTVQIVSGQALTPDRVNGLRLRVGALNNVNQHLVEAYVDIGYNQAPTATVTGPSGTVLTTSTPTITHTYSDPEGDPQERVRYKVYPASVYGLSGFDPASSSGAAWASAPLISSATSRVVGVPLAAGTYRAYVQVADAGSGGRFGPWAEGPEFTLDLDTPNAPVIFSADGNDDEAWVLLRVRGYQNELTDNQATLRTDTTGWMAGTNTTIDRNITEFKQGPASLELTADADGDVYAYTAAPYTAVVAGSAFAALASFKADGAGRDCRVRLRWRDSGGAFILPACEGPLVADDSSGWVDAICVGVAPPGAAFADVSPLVLDALADEVHYVDAIALRASNMNLLSLNQATVETDLTGWTAGTNATMSRNVDLAAHGLASLQLTVVADGPASLRTPPGVAGLPALAATVYTFLVQCRAVDVARDAMARARFWDGAGALLDEFVSPAVLSGTDGWAGLAFTAPASPAGTRFLSLHLEVDSDALAGERFLFDAMSVSESPSTTWKPGQAAWSRGGLTDKTMEVQRSDDDGATWHAVRLSVHEYTATPSPDPFTLESQTQARDIIVDHEAPRGARVLYRARSRGKFAGLLLVGPWSYEMPAELATDGDWLKAPFDPAAKLRICLEAPLQSRAAEDQAVGKPIGRTGAVGGRADWAVSRGDLRGEEFDLLLSTNDDEEWAALQALRGLQTTLLLQTTYGDGSGFAEQWYVALGEEARITRTERAPAVGQLRMMSIAAREVRAPGS